MDINELTPEQLEKAKACKTDNELVELAKAEGIELSDAQLETITGGDNWYYCSNDTGGGDIIP